MADVSRPGGWKGDPPRRSPSPAADDGAILVQGLPPGVLRRALYCDESGISGGEKHYGFGALVMPYQRRGNFAAEISRIRADYGRPSEEIKWNKCSRQNVGFYKALVDLYFTTSYLNFHCMVIERAWVNTHDFHTGSIDLARRKHFTKFLSNKVVALSRAYPDRDIRTRVYVDKIPSSYAKAGEAMEVIGNRMASQALGLALLPESGRRA